MSENRRRLLAVLTGLLVAGSAGAGDWPQLLGPTRNGIASETGLLRSWPDGGPQKLWERQVGAGFSGPVAAGERVLVFHRVKDEEIIECLNAATGKTLWRFAYPTAYKDDFGFDEGPRATPVIADGQVFALGAEGTLTGLDLATGAKLWQKSLARAYQSPKGFFGFGTSPVVDGDRVLVNVGGPGAGVVAFARDTGRELWKATDQKASYSSPIVATVDSVRHAIFLTREGVLSLDPADGAVRFTLPFRARLNASVNAATPLVVDGILFVSAEYSVGGLAARIKKDGLDELWRSNDVMSNHYNTCVHHDGLLYGIDGRQEGGMARLRCVELRTGKERWTQPRFGCASLIWADGHLIALNERGELLLIEATPDAFRQKAAAPVLEAPCRAEIALAGGRLYARNGQRLVCLKVTQ